MKDQIKEMLIEAADVPADGETYRLVFNVTCPCGCGSESMAAVVPLAKVTPEAIETISESLGNQLEELVTRANVTRAANGLDPALGVPFTITREKRRRVLN